MVIALAPPYTPSTYPRFPFRLVRLLFSCFSNSSEEIPPSEGRDSEGKDMVSLVGWRHARQGHATRY
jgi:hypothetical protein